MRTDPTPPRSAPNIQEVRIGADVLELVSSSMYVEPLTAYREYLQNAADAIEMARERGLLAVDQEGQVDIDIDQAARTVRIRDNGTGIPAAEVQARLLGIGGSAKRGTRARGFRGVGRLAALGYAQTLTFRTRAQGEDSISEIVWDARRIRSAMQDPSAHDLASIVAAVVDVRVLDVEGFPDRFFEVEIGRIARQRGDRLLDVETVSAFLSQVAPVPFCPSFRHAEEIASRLRAGGGIEELKVRIDGGDPLTRPYRDRIPLGAGNGTIEDLQIVELPGLDGGLGAIGWFAHHDYQGAIPTGALVKGVRVRMGNVQIGDHTVLQGIFPEERFNSWTVGEVHVFDRRIVPNGRRDDFEANAHYANIVNQLSPIGREVARRCRTSSNRRTRLREFELAAREVCERLDLATQGGLDEARRARELAAARGGIVRMRRAIATDVLHAADRERMNETLEEVDGRLSGVRGMEADDPFQHLGETKRDTYREIIGLIYDCSTNHASAKALVDRIVRRISG